MTKIQGQFDVSLPVPINLAPDLPRTDLPPCLFQIEGDNVTILPLTRTETAYPDGDYEAKLTEIRVWISREIDLEREQKESLKLPTEEERTFERVLVEATRRFVTIIKHKINQWDLDTRHPVDAYNYAYSRSDTELGTVWPPMEQGTKLMPEYAIGTMIFNERDFQNELTLDIWQEVVADVSRPASVSLHDELLCDAKTFRSNMRYDAAALYAAIACELMLEKACVSILRRKDLSQKQCEAKVRGRKVLDLLKLLQRLEPSLAVKNEGIKELFLLRNRIAHGKAEAVSDQETNKALGTAEWLKQDLASILYSSG